MATKHGDGTSSPVDAGEDTGQSKYDSTVADTTDVPGEDGKSPTSSHHGSTDEMSSKKNAKDPNRPRRKKARRACFACQRAHLTCGDERPCLRCVKRGLQDSCTDGHRKKAKYLHDAPSEALVPGLGGTYHPGAATQAAPLSEQQQTSLAESPMDHTRPYFSIGPSNPDVTAMQESPVGPPRSPQMHDPPMVDAFASPGRASLPAETQMVVPPPGDQETSRLRQSSQQFDMPFDPSDPGFFNFDISGFGNQYGAQEFGMLGHMTSGAFGSPEDSSLSNSLGSGMNYEMSTGFSPLNTGYGYRANPYSNWSNNQPGSRQNSSSHGFKMQVNDMYPTAFAIGEGGTASISSASPNNSTLDVNNYGTNSPAANQVPVFAAQRSQSDFAPNEAPQPSIRNPFAPTGTDTASAQRRKRDPSIIYQSVKEPYSYTTGFHLLTAFLAKRFSKERTLRIAKALASIRPSFISCTRELSRDDLIFMEKGFQRNLLLYDDFLGAYGCPTLIIRRTGEVAAVSKEFSLLTGWRRDVLLGKEPNLNINYGSGSAQAAGDGGSRAIQAVPGRQLGNGVETQPGRPQPVFVAELLDDDTAVEFYEDFAKMAFGDSRGSVMRRGKLLKYKTKDEEGGGPEEKTLGTVGGGINVLGDKDGKVDVMFCHTVKRDTFDIPMMVVMNFLPIIP